MCFASFQTWGYQAGQLCSYRSWQEIESPSRWLESPEWSICFYLYKLVHLCDSVCLCQTEIFTKPTCGTDDIDKFWSSDCEQKRTGSRMWDICKNSALTCQMRLSCINQSKFWCLLYFLCLYSFTEHVWCLQTLSDKRHLFSVIPLCFTQNPIRDSVFFVLSTGDIGVFWSTSSASSDMLIDAFLFFWRLCSLLSLGSCFPCDLPLEFNSGCDQTSTDKTRARAHTHQVCRVSTDLWRLRFFFSS